MKGIGQGYLSARSLTCTSVHATVIILDLPGNVSRPTNVTRVKAVFQIGWLNEARIKFTFQIYTASKVKHHLNIFQEKKVKLFKHEFILVTCLKRNKVVTIYSKV